MRIAHTCILHSYFPWSSSSFSAGSLTPSLSLPRSSQDATGSSSSNSSVRMRVSSLRRPRPTALLEIAVNCVSQRCLALGELFKDAGLGKLSLSFLGPSGGGRPPVERLRFTVNGGAVSHYPDLCSISLLPVAPLSLRNGTHLLQALINCYGVAISWRKWAQKSLKQVK